MAFINENNIKQAIRDVFKKIKSIRAAAADYNIHPATLQYRLKTFRKLHPDVNEIVSDDSAQENEVEEESLEKYFIKSSQIKYGLTYHQAQTLAYEFAIHCNKNNFPKSWIENKLAGLFWMQSFMKHHPKLSLRRPKNTSFARSTAFNSHTVNEFSTNYISITTKYKFTPDRIYNIDESGISTVLPCPKVIAETGKKQVGQAVSGERGQLFNIRGYRKCHRKCLTSSNNFPEDVGVYSSFKANCKTAFNNWMATNPGKQITIYDVPALSNIAFKNSFTIKNITSGFKKSGLWPINQLVFNDKDFLSCYVTNRPAATSNEQQTENEANNNINIVNNSSEEKKTMMIMPTKKILINQFHQRPKSSLTLKAQPRVKKINSRQGKSRIYTSTPEKQIIEEILKTKEEKPAKLKKKVEPVKKKLKLVESSSEEDSISALSLSDSVGDISEEEFPLLCDDEELNLKHFVLVQFCTKKTKLHYIGCIQRIINRDELKINFLRRK
ncbi:hypothetical protein NQ314_017493, partial [Rhamnusium bicolor]